MSADAQQQLLRERIASLEAELSSLRSQLATLETEPAAVSGTTPGTEVRAETDMTRKTAFPMPASAEAQEPKARRSEGATRNSASLPQSGDTGSGSGSTSGKTGPGEARDNGDEPARGGSQRGVVGSGPEVMRDGDEGKEDGKAPTRWPLRREEYERYGRQLVVPGVGVQGQLKLKIASVLIVGAGGLGCPAAAYLAGAGVGRVGIVDADIVEASNLHRQIGHATSRVGTAKVDSLVEYLSAINPLPTYVPHRCALTPANAGAVVSGYDLVLDCTDRPSTRYLVSDAAVVCGKPLVSASALRTDGQLIVLNHPPRRPGDGAGGPCYRCVFPKPPPAETVLGCGEGGVLGPVVGVMGVLQALEALKVLLGLGGARGRGDGPPAAFEMLLFSALASPRFRTVRMRGRRRDCVACGDEAALSAERLREGGVDYEAFCGVASPVRLLREDERISATEYAAVASSGRPHVLLDVRDPAHFGVASLPGAVNIEAGRFLRGRVCGDEDGGWMPSGVPDGAPVFVVCRVGNDSQLVARRLMDEGGRFMTGREVRDIRGGLRAWRDEVDETLPFL